MPHKHKRKRGDDEAEFNLPPTQRARPLPTTIKSSKKLDKTKGQKKAEPTKVQRPKKRNAASDTGDNGPRAFRRLMAVAQGKKIRSGLDDGVKEKPEPKATSTEALRIRPGEDMRSFSARVDAALPVSGLTKKSIIKDGKDELGLKVRRTRKERQMHKLYDEWRAEDEKIKEQREEERELAAEREMDNDPSGTSSSYPTDVQGDSKPKKGRKKRQAAEEDPWEELKRNRAEAKVGLHDVAKAPPELHKQTTRQLKVRGAAVDVENVPKAAGSLRRREELQGARKEVIEAYRKIREHEQAKLDAKK